MPKPTCFHERTSALCESYRYKDWAGYCAVSSYSTYTEREYFALRHSVGVIDVSPLFKYDIKGPDAIEYLCQVMAKNIAKLKVNQVTYCCWCDDDGKIIDDGTVTRLDEGHFRVTAAEPCFFWFERYAEGYDVEIIEVTDDIGALSLQGPLSKELLRQLVDINMDDLKFFRHASCKVGTIPIELSRTGYTGDLGYELWVHRDQAIDLYDALMKAGQNFGLLPCGLDAMDITRIEAGFIMNGVDYFSAHHCFNDHRKSSPFDMGLDWTVNLKRPDFNGRDALVKEKEKGSAWKFVGLVYDWDEIEGHFRDFDLPPHLCGAAWRDGRPVYNEDGLQIGQATSGVWSPLLKKNIALATLRSDYAKMNSVVGAEFTVEYQRRKVSALVTGPQFFDPPRKRS